MSYTHFAMDTSFYHSLGAYDFDARCEMLKDLGFDATYLTLWSEAAWADVPQLAQVKARHGLDIAAVYVTLDIAGEDDQADNGRILHLLHTMEGCADVEVAITSSDAIQASDPVGDPAAMRWLRRLLAVAEQRGITLSLYPHSTYWLERVDDAVRLCRAIDHPSLRAVFCGFHWYAVDGANLAATLEAAAPFLHSVNLAGTRRVGQSADGVLATIEPLDEGELDNFVVLGLLRDVGYRGKVGIQGFSVAGDVYAKLRRSLAALHDMQRRLDEHPQWARLRPDGVGVRLF